MLSAHLFVLTATKDHSTAILINRDNTRQLPAPISLVPKSLTNQLSNPALPFLQLQLHFNSPPLDEAPQLINHCYHPSILPVSHTGTISSFLATHYLTDLLMPIRLVPAKELHLLLQLALPMVRDGARNFSRV
jgi:hypothetical protein